MQRREEIAAEKQRIEMERAATVAVYVAKRQGKFALHLKRQAKKRMEEEEQLRHKARKFSYVEPRH